MCVYSFLVVLCGSACVSADEEAEWRTAIGKALTTCSKCRPRGQRGQRHIVASKTDAERRIVVSSATNKAGDSWPGQ